MDALSVIMGKGEGGKMKKKILISAVVLVVLIGVAYRMISTGFYNLDYIGQGRLLSATFIDRACITNVCEENEDWQMTITDPAQLKKLESAFFNKFQDVNHLTKEDGGLTFILHYEHKDIEFHTGGFNKGSLIYYIDRQIAYRYDKDYTEFFAELFTIHYPD
jgi:hypothetical protein